MPNTSSLSNERELTPAAEKILLHLDALDDVCHSSAEELGKELNLTESTVLIALKELSDRGFIAGNFPLLT